MGVRLLGVTIKFLIVWNGAAWKKKFLSSLRNDLLSVGQIDRDLNYLFGIVKFGSAGKVG